MTMIQPPIDKLVKKAGNKYKVAALTGKEALRIQRKNIENEIELEPGQEKEITKAAKLVADGKVVISDETED